MNSWNPEEVSANYKPQSLGFISPTPSSTLTVNQRYLATAIRELVSNEQADPSSLDTVTKARATATPPAFKAPYALPEFGCVVQWVSEIGDTTTLDGLLADADMHLSPSWDNGGLHYPRCDGKTGTDGVERHMDPFTGNAAIGYARLNVSDGQRKMAEKPWTGEEVRSRAWIDGLDLGQGVDWVRAGWYDNIGPKGAMVLTGRTWDGKETR